MDNTDQTDAGKEKTSVSFQELAAILPEKIRTDRVNLMADVLTFYQTLLAEWQEWIDEQQEDLKKTHEGRLTWHARTASKDTMKPLFKKLHKNQLSMDLLYALSSIAQLIQERKYVQANKAYLQMAIGNAPWPIGVAAVGIHERSSRDRLSAPHQQAHVLNDEVTRKWVQMIKRFITFCQRVRPPFDPKEAMG